MAQSNLDAARRARASRPPGQPGQNQQTWQYSVSFEFDARPVLTHRGLVTASSYGNACARATKAAQKALRPVKARSMVCALLERVETATATIAPVEPEQTGEGLPAEA